MKNSVVLLVKVKTQDAEGVAGGHRGYGNLPTGSRSTRDVSSYKVRWEPLRPPEQRKGKLQIYIGFGRDLGS